MKCLKLGERTCSFPCSHPLSFPPPYPPVCSPPCYPSCRVSHCSPNPSAVRLPSFLQCVPLFTLSVFSLCSQPQPAWSSLPHSCCGSTLHTHFLVSPPLAGTVPPLCSPFLLGLPPLHPSKLWGYSPLSSLIFSLSLSFFHAPFLC